MMTIVGISGSLRQSSFNTSLLRAAAAVVPEGAELKIETIWGIPLYDGDVEASQGIPATVRALKDRIAASDGLVLASPEYNNSVPGPFKNAIDWLSRPASDIPRVFGSKPTALIGASPGGFGTVLAQSAWLPVLRTLGTEPWFGRRLLVSRAQTVFDSSGNLTDERVRHELEQFMAGFVAFVGASSH